MHHGLTRLSPAAPAARPLPTGHAREPRIPGRGWTSHDPHAAEAPSPGAARRGGRPQEGALPPGPDPISAVAAQLAAGGKALEPPPGQAWQQVRGLFFFTMELKTLNTKKTKNPP